MYEVFDCKQVFGCFNFLLKIRAFSGWNVAMLGAKKKRHWLVQRMFLEKIPLNKKKSGKKEEKTHHALPKNNSLEEGEKKRENSTLTFRNNETSSLSHVNQETTPHWKGHRTWKETPLQALSKGAGEKIPLEWMEYHHPLPLPTHKKNLHLNV